ncbi:histidine phosphatase family protein [Lactobacillus sp. S2-2]|uniref:histidine phosphatase family protein n=1 Tax=Lactobacillus sp. S2-2 TaxID=2692917 RepID=UPI001F159137|nr:histidine phosphatase family protein [Lactobacillus sp. S2-2]MCF6515262.1 histidine phosphatase family protein [Lactobacillus sp. S2-2]
MADFNLYVVRHGQTYFNIFNKLQGWSNSPLTQKGIDGAKQTADKLSDIPFKAVYCSDTTRAQDTAQIIIDQNLNQNLQKPIVKYFFREHFYGYYEGLDSEQTWFQAGAPHGEPSFKEIIQSHDMDTAKNYLKEADPFHMAENAEEYWNRLNQGLNLIINNSDLKDGDNVLLISHGNTLLSLVEKYSNGEFDLTKRPNNGSVTKLEFKHNQFKVISYNQ